MSTVTEAKQFNIPTAVNSAQFVLKGGKYAVITKSTGAGTIDLTVMSFDLVTFVKTITTIAAVTGFAVIDLPPGQYRFEITGFTLNFVEVVSVPS
jgi:hypothetical protein